MRVQTLAVFAVIAATASSAATPPALIHYQGVLRDAADRPLTGSFDVVFRLYDAPSGGAEVLIDSHLAASGQAIQVTGGLFAVPVGGGQVVDGSGPGTYASLGDAFRDYASLWLEVRVGTETLVPRTRVLAAAYALNAANLDGRPAASFLDTSATPQVKAGAIAVASAAPSTTAVTGLADYCGGFFQDIDDSAYAFVGYGDRGIEAWGADVGGYFHNSVGSAYARVGSGDVGISAYGDLAGGVFESTNGSGLAYVGYGNYGIDAGGNQSGGRFQDRDSSGSARVGYGDLGIDASGTQAGGYFLDINEGSYAHVASFQYGIYAKGSVSGGNFESATGSGQALIASVDRGISASGNTEGGEFRDANNSGVAFVGYGDRGIWAKGTFAGGTFSHPDDTTFWADVARPTWKIVGTGAVSFVQNHPDRKDRVLAYAAPEGDEVAVYTRGTARLVDGEARVRLGSTFALVANPDVGLTVHLTPLGEAVPLAVKAKSTSEIVVRGPAGSDAEFDYLVYGLRIGFERYPVEQHKEREAFLPSQAAFDRLGATVPELASTSALARFSSMRAPPSLARAEALASRINEGRRSDTAASDEAGAPGVATAEPAIPARPRAALALVPVTGSVYPGDVVALDLSTPGALRAADVAVDGGVAGCALELPAEAEIPLGWVALATTGVVLCNADAREDAIAVGDLLTTSTTPGHAMRARGNAEGAILGKAMEPLADGTGRIRVLVTLR